MPAPVRAFVGLGANLGEPARAIAAGLHAIDALPGTRVLAVSSLYRSAPVDADGPDFLNAVAALETTLEAPALLAALLAIERAQGRDRSSDARTHTGRSAARPLDLDLLAWDDAAIDTPGLQLPHPRMHLRAFVLAPLAEIAPDFRLPGHPPLARLLADCTDQRIARAAPPLMRPAARDTALAPR